MIYSLLCRSPVPSPQDFLEYHTWTFRLWCLISCWVMIFPFFFCFGSEMKTAPGRSYNCWLLIILQLWNTFIIRRPHRVLWNDVTDVINSPSKIHFTNFRGACLWLWWNMESSKSLDGKILDKTSWIWTNKSFLHSAMKPLWPVLVGHSFVSLSVQRPLRSELRLYVTVTIS